MALLARGQITLALLEDGLPGADAVLYQLEVSPDQINKSAEGVLSSTTIIIKSFKRVGNSTRSAYSCRFKIYENSTLKYTSSANESSKVYTISSVAIKSIKVEMYVAGATSSLLETKTILLIQDGTKGDTGLSGALLRPRGAWKSQTSYIKNSTFVDTVIHNSVNYMCVASHTSDSTFDSSKWIEANELIFVATQALLAGKGTIDVLGAGELFVGNLLKTEGWSMTNGAIRHTKTGLTLAADGKIYSPSGAAIIVGDAPLEDYTSSKAQETVDKLEIGGVNLLDGTDKVNSLITNNTVNQSIISFHKFYLEGFTTEDNFVLSFDLSWSDNVDISNSNRIVTQGSGSHTGWNYSFPAFDLRAEITKAISEGKTSIRIKNKTFKLSTNNLTNEYLNVGIRFDNCLGTFYFTKFQIEKGTKSTQWTPSIVDTTNAITSAQTTANNATSAINAMNDDTIFDIAEKLSIRSQWEVIWGAANTTTHNTTGSYYKTLTAATGITNTLTSLVNTLKDYLNNKALYTNSNTTGFSRSTLAGYFKEYLNEEVRVWNEVGKKYSDTIIEDLEITGVNLWENCNTDSGHMLGGVFTATDGDPQHRVLKKRIPVVPGNKLTYQIWNPKSILNHVNSNRCTWLKADGTYLSQLSIPYLSDSATGIAKTYLTGELNPPTNAAYLILGFIQGSGVRRDTSIKIKVERGTKKTEYVDSPADVEYELRKEENLLINSKITRGKYLTNAGAEFDNASWFFSDYIPVRGMVYICTSGYSYLGSSPSVCYYDQEKTFIKGINNAGASIGKLVTIIEPDIKFIRVSGEIKDLGSYKVEYGKTGTTFRLSPEDSYDSVTDISSDGKLTPSEKLQINVEWIAIQKEKTTLNDQATALSISNENTLYNTHYNNLSNYITPLLADMKVTSTVSRSAFNNYFSNYYLKRSDLQTAIINKNKTLANNAQNTANTAVENSNTIKTGVNLASWSGDFKNIETFNLWKSKGYWTIPSNMSSCTFSVVNNNLRIDFPAVGTGLTYQPELIIKGVTAGKTYSFFVKYKSDGVVFNELLTYPIYYCAKSLPASPTKFSVHRNTFTCTKDGDIRFYFRRNDASYPTNFIEIESIMFCEGTLDNLPAIWSKSIANQEEDADNQLGGVNLFNTVDCQIQTGDWFVKNPKWTETGFTFTTGTTASSSGRLHNVIPKNGYYTISFRAKCSGVNLPFTITVCDQIVLSTTITNTFKDYLLTIKTNKVSPSYKFIDFRLHNVSIDVEVADLMVEHGTVQHKFSYAPRQLPVSIDQKANAILATADLMEFKNQSGVPFASMFNDPNTGNPTLKAGYIDVDNLSVKLSTIDKLIVSGVKYKFSALPANTAYTVTADSPVNIDGLNKDITLSCTEDCVGKVINIFNKTVVPAQKSDWEIGGCTLVRCANAFSNTPKDVGYLSVSNRLNPDGYPDQIQFLSGVMQLCCVKEFCWVYLLDNAGNEIGWNQEYVIRWVIMNSAYTALKSLYNTSDATRYIYTCDAALNDVSFTSVTNKIYIKRWNDYLILDSSNSNSSTSVDLPSDAFKGKRIRIMNSSTSSKTIYGTVKNITTGTTGSTASSFSLASGKTADLMLTGSTWVYTIF